MLRIFKNWNVPTVILVLLILSMVFRWDSIASNTKDGVMIITKADRWNGAVWQETIKNGSYTEKIIQPPWIESGRTRVEKQIEVQEPVWGKKYDEYFKTEMNDIISHKTVQKTIQEAPPPYYWLSRDGLTKIWSYTTSVMAIWLLTAIFIRNKKNKQETLKPESLKP